MITKTEIKSRLEAARKKLPEILSKLGCLPAETRALIGSLPEAIKTTGDIRRVEQVCETLSRSAAVSAATKSLAAIGRQTVELATHPSPKVSAPIVKGIDKALSAQAVLDAKVEACRALPRKERIAALVRLRNEGIVAENNAKQQANHEKVQARLKTQLRSRR